MHIPRPLAHGCHIYICTGVYLKDLPVSLVGGLCGLSCKAGTRFFGGVLNTKCSFEHRAYFSISYVLHPIQGTGSHVSESSGLSDGDGLRDDVQRWLAVNYGTKFTLEEYKIAKTYAILFQRSLLYSDDKDKALNLVAERDTLYDALTYLRVEKKLQDFEEENPDEAAVDSFLRERLAEIADFIRGLEETVVNTNFRLVTYREFDSQLGGEVFSFASSRAEFLRALSASESIVKRELGGADQ